MSGNYVKDIDEARFESEVMQKSHELPVLVDFWADWCGPCRALGPVLEKLAGEYDGGFLLAKINADTNPKLTQRFGVRGLPTVKVFRNGEVVTEFVGALPESAIRPYIDKHLVSAADKLLKEAKKLAEGNPAAAIELLKRGLELEPGKHALILALADLYADTKQGDAAAALLQKLPANIGVSEPAKLIAAKLKLAQFADQPVDESDPLAVKHRDALTHIQAARYAQGLALLTEILRDKPGWQDGRAQETLLSVFAQPNIDPELVSAWRRKIATLLH